MALSTIPSLLDHVSIFAFRHWILDCIPAAAADIPEVISRNPAHGAACIAA
jgi:hypothetical protein